jgi:hypothetical protein
MNGTAPALAGAVFACGESRFLFIGVKNLLKKNKTMRGYIKKIGKTKKRK